MNTCRNHTVHNGERRFNVLNALLAGPWTKALDLFARDNRNGAILMPSERPVSRVALVEKDSANRTGLPAQNVRNIGTDSVRMSQQPCQLGTACNPNAGLALTIVSNGFFELADYVQSQTGDEVSTIAIQIE